MEGDDKLLKNMELDFQISIHTLRVEGDPFKIGKLNIRFLFQSTPSVWRVTRQIGCVQQPYHKYISIHTLRVEGDLVNINASKLSTKFQSTPSVWRVTGRTAAFFLYSGISIHTLRVEGDCFIAS